MQNSLLFKVDKNHRFPPAFCTLAFRFFICLLLNFQLHQVDEFLFLKLLLLLFSLLGWIASRILSLFLQPFSHGFHLCSLSLQQIV